LFVTSKATHINLLQKHRFELFILRIVKDFTMATASPVPNATVVATPPSTVYNDKVKFNKKVLTGLGVSGLFLARNLINAQTSVFNYSISSQILSVVHI